MERSFPSLFCSDCRRICGQEPGKQAPNQDSSEIASHKSDSQPWQLHLHFHFLVCSLIFICDQNGKVSVPSNWEDFGPRTRTLVDSLSKFISFSSSGDISEIIGCILKARTAPSFPNSDCMECLFN